ncbi:MAG: glycosyltransferase [Thermodesulfobacteriota bacterium]
MPQVSVILTSYNHEKYIREAIDSVLAQTFNDFDLIIWDDASSDKSWEIINSFIDVRIARYRNAQNMRGGNINRALKVVLGEYIAIHHSDDIWEPDKLERQVAFLNNHPDIGAVFTNALAIGEDGSLLNKPGHFYSNIFDQPNRTRHEWLNHFFYKGNALCHPSVLIRKQCYDTCGPYRYYFAQLTDLDMWIRLCMKYDIHVMPEKLVRFRVRADEANASGDKPETRVRGATEFFLLLRNYLKITSKEEMAAIFPDAKTYLKDKGFVPEFVIAITALNANTNPMLKAFGVLLLFDLLSDSDKYDKIRLTHGFDYMDLKRISGQFDIFFIEAVSELSKALSDRDSLNAKLNETLTNQYRQLSGLRQEVAERNEHISGLNQAVADRDSTINNLKAFTKNLSRLIEEKDTLISQLMSSNSWRITRPLRVIARLLRGQYGIYFSFFKKAHSNKP